MVDKVVLMNLYGEGKGNFSILPYSQNLGLATIAQGLRENGFHNISCFPQKEIKGSISEEDTSLHVVGELMRASRPKTTHTVYGMSVSSGNYHKLDALSRLIREYDENATIVVGGPMFVREQIYVQGQRLNDPVDQVLKSKTVDFAVVGHCQAFIDYVVDGVTDSAGMFYYSGNSVVGKGRSKYPKLEQIPFVEWIADVDEFSFLFKDISEIRNIDIMVDTGCGNGCDFCHYTKGVSVDVHKVKQRLEELLDDRLTRLNIMDSNPFESNRIHKYAEIFDYANSINPNLLKTVFLDPALINDEIIDFIIRHKVTNMFIGRDCVTEEDAEMVGCKYKHKVRSQEQLDSELVGIINLIEKLKVSREEQEFPGPHFVNLSYILNPSQSKSSMLRVLDEVEMWRAMSTFDVCMHEYLNLLVPYPGTKLRKRFIDKVVDPEDYCVGFAEWNQSPVTLLMGQGLRSSVALTDWLNLDRIETSYDFAELLNTMPSEIHL